MESKPKEKLAQWINTPIVGSEGFTSLHFAAFNGNLNMLKYLIDQGADAINTQK